MERKGKSTTSASDQHDSFIETARALECNEDEAAFDEKLKTIARHKPKAEMEVETAKSVSKPQSKRELGI